MNIFYKDEGGSYELDELTIDEYVYQFMRSGWAVVNYTKYSINYNPREEWTLSNGTPTLEYQTLSIVELVTKLRELFKYEALNPFVPTDAADWYHSVSDQLDRVELQSAMSDAGAIYYAKSNDLEFSFDELVELKDTYNSFKFTYNEGDQDV